MFYGKKYLITGGSSGIGFAVAKMLAQQGARVLLVAKREKRLREAIKMLPGEGHLYYPFDLAKIEEINSIFLFCREHDFYLNGMVYSAGIAPLCLVSENSPELMEMVFRINVFAFIEMVKFFQQKEYSCEGSKIVGISSIMNKGAGYRQTLYGASKGALTASTKLMAKELLNRNIKINSVAPGVCDTEMYQKLKEKSSNLDEKVKQNQILGALQPEQVGKTVLFLLSEAADAITGTEILYDGGSILK